jgi:hypothetical protein
VLVSALYFFECSNWQSVFIAKRILSDDDVNINYEYFRISIVALNRLRLKKCNKLGIKNVSSATLSRSERAAISDLRIVTGVGRKGSSATTTRPRSQVGICEIVNLLFV